MSDLGYEFASYDTAETSMCEEVPQYIVQPDRKLALQHYIMAGKLGESEACNCVGLMLEEKDNAIGAVTFY